MFELRPYQQECIDLILDAYARDPRGQELVVLPTAAGKTVVFCEVIRRLEVNTLIIAHRDELLDQAAEKYRLIKPDAIIGKVGSGQHDYGGEMTVASIATISRPEHLKRLQAIGYSLVIVDESHHIAAGGYQRVLEALPNAFVLMVTATPDRLDGKPIIDKPPLYQRTIREMIAQGYLCDVRAIAIRTETHLDSVRTQMGDYNEHELDLLVNTPDRNGRVVEAYQEHAYGRTAICFAVTVDHAKQLAEAFNEQGIDAAMVTGDTPLQERKKLYHQLRTGEIKVLSNVLVLCEGFDEPMVDCVIMARPTQSRALFLQCVGRGLRLAPAKKDCIILDLTDNCLRYRLQPQNLSQALGMPLADGVSVKEKMKQEAEEREKRSAEERKLKVQRKEDVQVNLLHEQEEALEWERLDTDVFMLEVGEEKHRIALVKSATRSGYYRVVARLAPYFELQEWSEEQPLSWAQQTAEKRARMLQKDTTGKARRLVDMNAPWRRKPVDPESDQARLLRKYRIPITPTMTRGEASDLLEKKFAEIARWKQRNQHVS